MVLDAPNSKRVRRYLETQTARGLTRVSVWVPNNRADDIRRFAARLRHEEGVLLPRESSASEQASKPSPVPTGSEIALDQLLELIAAARDEPPEKTLTELCAGRGPIGTAATFARIAGRLGYVPIWRREIAEELAELRRQWIGTPRTAPEPEPAQRHHETPAAPQPRSIDLNRPASSRHLG